MRNREYKLDLDKVTSVEDIKHILSVMELSVHTVGEDILYTKVKEINKEKELFKLVGENNETH